MTQFKSEAYSLVFYPDPRIGKSGSDTAVFFAAHGYETDDPKVVDALKSERAQAAGISVVDSEPETTSEAPAVPPETPPTI